MLWFTYWRTLLFQPPVREHLTYQYVLDQFRRYQLTTKKICREQDEVEHMARSYLCYLESKRKYDVSIESTGPAY